MKPIKEYSPSELYALYEELIAQYQEEEAKNLKLNMARGKPAATQLDLSMELLNLPKNYLLEDGTDARNYGVLEGIPECRRLFGELLGINPEQVLMGGNSSLTMMFDTMAYLCLFGTQGSRPWSYYKCEGKPVKFLCPVPGYDRHFTICQELGIEMIAVPLLEDGPDMDIVTRLVKEDDSIRGIWCVPLHANPEGVCFSDKVVDTLASMETAAEDFRIFWDNAYGVHHIYEDVPLKNILDACEEHGHADRPYYFFSTSKISFPGAGVAVLAASPANIKEIRGHMSAQTISNDKLNQLRHVQFFQTPEGIHQHMKKLAEQLRPKFDIVLDTLDTQLFGSELASWSHPKGGYFISLNTLPGCAKRTVELAKKAGVTLTGAGATYPYGKDPEDRNIRIAPTYPTPEELAMAMNILVLCVKIAGIETLINK